MLKHDNWVSETLGEGNGVKNLVKDKNLLEEIAENSDNLDDVN